MSVVLYLPVKITKVIFFPFLQTLKNRKKQFQSSSVPEKSSNITNRNFNKILNRFKNSLSLETKPIQQN